MANSTASMGFENLEIGYWNVGWTETKNVPKPKLHGIRNHIGDVIEAMEANKCHIVFCTDTQDASENLSNIKLIGNDMEKRLGSGEYEYNGEKYNVFWARDKFEKKDIYLEEYV